MKKFINAIKNGVQKIVKTMSSKFVSTRVVLANNRAEGFVDSGVKILIAVVIGALLLGGLYVLFGDTILPTLTNKIRDLFNYAG